MRNELSTIPSSGQCAPTSPATDPCGGLAADQLASARDVAWLVPHG
jgi:hypothetical protein